MDDDVGDERLSLIFTACHPVLSTEARAALTLRLIGGLTTDEIARAFLSNEATIAQRIVRAKKTLGNAGLTFEVPRGKEREQRLASVLEVIYLIFNEGYSATAGEDLIRPAVCAEAQRLGRILAALAPDEPEVLRSARADGDPGLASSRPHGARRRPGAADRTEPRPLGPAPDPAGSRRVATRRGPGRRQRALRPAGRARRLPREGAQGGGYRLEEDRGLYNSLSAVMPSPVVDLNRAVATAWPSARRPA